MIPTDCRSSASVDASAYGSKFIAELIEDADEFVETDLTELQPIDGPAATYSEFFDDEPLRLPGFD